MVSSLWTNLLMKIAFCIGNGESRAGFNLQKLKTFGTLYGSGTEPPITLVMQLLIESNFCETFQVLELVKIKNKYL